jgi:hypothetical protein
MGIPSCCKYEWLLAIGCCLLAIGYCLKNLPHPQFLSFFLRFLVLGQTSSAAPPPKTTGLPLAGPDQARSPRLCPSRSTACRRDPRRRRTQHLRFLLIGAAVVYWLLSIGYWLLSIVYWLLSIAAVHAAGFPEPVPGLARAAVLALTCSYRGRACTVPCRSPCTGSSGARAGRSPCRSPCTGPSGARAGSSWAWAWVWASASQAPL